MTAPPPPDDASSLPFTPVSRHGDIPAGEGRTFEVGGRLVAVFFDGEAYHAMDDLCPHMGASLGSGPFVDGVVTCPWHAWRFRACDRGSPQRRRDRSPRPAGWMIRHPLTA